MLADMSSLQFSVSPDATPLGSSTLDALSALSRVSSEGSRSATSTGGDEIQKRAFRAVVKDDAATIEELVVTVPKEEWTKWRNKAQTDLITLAQERGSSAAYSLLAQALGLLTEPTREAYEERESVWIFNPGEVQPRRATVLEDTDASLDSVLVEYWDGDEPPHRADRCSVLKARVM